MKEYLVDLIDKHIAKELIVKNHYSHSWSSCRYALGLLLPTLSENYEFLPPTLFGYPVGVAIYGFPVGRQVVQSISPNLSKDEVLELTRLWVHDNEPRNTESFFLGRTFDWLRKNTSIKVLISYSDPMYNHLGTIYQATNWIYQGNETMLIKGYFHCLNGEVLHPRTCVAKYGTIKEGVLSKIDPSYKRIPMKKKHRYIYILHRKDRKTIMNLLKHLQKDYPKEL